MECTSVCPLKKTHDENGKLSISVFASSIGPLLRALFSRFERRGGGKLGGGLGTKLGLGPLLRPGLETDELGTEL